MPENLNSGNKKTAFFEVDARILYQLGEQLVSNKSIALAELVKNSYDADSTKTEIILKNIKNKTGGSITIKDNGLGISPERFESTWMRIATIDSEENPVSKKYGRKKAGEKGIGRIACRKLAKELKLISVSENEKKEKIRLSAHFYWDNFFSGSDLNKIPVDYYYEVIDPCEPTGTELNLLNTTEKWTEANAKRLNTELWDLFTPKIFREERVDSNSNNNDPGFNYEITSDEFSAFEDTLTEKLLKNAWAKLSGYVDESGKATYTLKTIKMLKNNVEYIHVKENNFKTLKNTNLEIYFFKYISYFFSGSDLKLNDAYEIGHDRGGVKVYADGFRIFGYGEVGNDWLDLNKDQSRSIGNFQDESSKIKSEDPRPGLDLFVYRQLFGYVNYDKKLNPGLSISINRESIDDTSEYQELVEFVRLGVNITTVKYSDEKRKYSKYERERKEALEKEINRRAEEAKNALKKKKEQAKTEEEELKKKIVGLEEEAKIVNNNISEIKEEVNNHVVKKKKLDEKKRDAEKKARFKNTPESWHKLDLLRKKVSEIESEENSLNNSKKNLETKYSSLNNEIESAKLSLSNKSKSNFETIKKKEEEVIESEKDKIKVKERKYDEALSILRVLASTGTMISIFTHEIQSFISGLISLNSNVNSLLSKVNDIDPEDKKYYESESIHLSEKIETIQELSNIIGLSGGVESRTEMKRWNIQPIIDKIFIPFKIELNKRGIEYENAIPERLRSPTMYRSELIAIFNNLMTNSVKAVTNQKVRKIKIIGNETEDEKISIKFMDTGKGLDKDKWELVFDPFETNSEPDLNFGIGTGLGLKIVSDLVSGYEGTVRFIEPPSEWKTCIEIILPLV